MRNYTFRIIIEPDEQGTYHGYVPCLRGCHTWGETIEKTRENLRDAMSAYIASLVADGEQVPQEQGLEYFETVSEQEIERVKPSSAYA